jgi:hypothetical protein
VEESDRPFIDEGLAKDTFHDGITSDVFFPKYKDANGVEQPDPRYVSNAFEDEKGPIFFIQGTKVLKLSAIFRDNADRRNLKAIRACLEQLRQFALTNGFTELQVSTKSPKLAEFLEKYERFNKMQTVENREIVLQSLL